MDSLMEIFGQFNSFEKKLSEAFHVAMIQRDGALILVGEPVNIKRSKAVILGLSRHVEAGNKVDEQKVNYLIELEKQNRTQDYENLEQDVICRTIQGTPIKPKTIGQKEYVDAIKEKMIVFGIGPAGTGKTYLAMAMAITALRAGEVERIIMTRPAIEAGERLGFLPGDLQSKIDPYLRPLYDALYTIMGAETVARHREKGSIEVVPLAYMRGRTLDNAYIILDEAQNTTSAQMKMFLTRIGFGSKVIVTGDNTQKDLPEGQLSGLDSAQRILSKIPEISFQYLTSADVVRHPLVQKIVRAYEDYEENKKSRKSDRRYEHRRKT
ncbi:MAG: PhoH family protein [Lachnospiraceae bacterium]|nr:PhoH family protein [Lachnospiraceae bacterium]